MFQLAQQMGLVPAVLRNLDHHRPAAHRRLAGQIDARDRAPPQRLDDLKALVFLADLRPHRFAQRLGEARVRFAILLDSDHLGD
jgi:hypothetical protein